MRVLTLLLLLVLHSLYSASISAEQSLPETLPLKAGTEPYLLGTYLQILEDPGGQMTLQDVIGASGFSPVHVDAPNVGVSGSAFWLTLRLTNTDPVQTHWWLEHADFLYQWLDVWLVRDGKQILHRKGGSLRPRQPDMPGARGHVFALEIPGGATVDLYLRGQTGFYGFFPLRLWTPEAFGRYQANESIFHGIFIGITLAMILYNLFFYLNLREPSYLLYVAYMIALLGGQLGLTGISSASFFENHPLLCNVQWMMWVVLVQLFAAMFTLAFLLLSRRERMFLQICILVILVTPIAGLFAGFMVWTASLQGISLISNAGMLLIGIRYTLRGDRSAAYYSAGFGILIVTTLLFLMVGGGGLPFHPLTFYSLSIGIALQSIFLTIALSTRIKQLKIERDRAEEDQIQVQSAMLTAQAEVALVREEAIEQRQLALLSQQEALEQKRIALDKERQLVEKERMANLGLLSAGIAHEINNPNNFMRISMETAGNRLQDLRKFIDELVAEDTEEEIIAGFRRRFDGIQSQIGIALEGSERIQGIVKSMRSASRNDTGEPVVFDPVDPLQSTLDLVKPTFRNSTAFDTSGLQTGFKVKGFPSQLNQVFTNFIVNGCHAIEEKQKASQPQGARTPGVIRLFTLAKDGELTIGIEDDGCGMSEAVKAKLFQPFFTTKGADKGTGLGLGICRGIVTEHGGRIEVDSTDGVGTTFRVILPLA